MDFGYVRIPVCTGNCHEFYLRSGVIRVNGFVFLF